MAALDGMVLEHLPDRLFVPERLRVILDAYLARSAEADADRRVRLAQARKMVTEADGRMNRLLGLVANGMIRASDPSLKERSDGARAARTSAGEQVRLLEGAAGSAGPNAITPEKIYQLSVAPREALANGDPAFRKAYLWLFVDQVIVGDVDVRLRGPTASLAKAAALGELPNTGGEAALSFVQQWRPVDAAGSGDCRAR